MRCFCHFVIEETTLPSAYVSKEYSIRRLGRELFSSYRGQIRWALQALVFLSLLHVQKDKKWTMIKESTAWQYHRILHRDVNNYIKIKNLDIPLNRSKLWQREQEGGWISQQIKFRVNKEEGLLMYGNKINY